MLAGESGWEIWNPATGEVGYRFDQPVAVTQGWLVHYAPEVSVAIVDLAAGTQRRVPLPEGFVSVDDGALSADTRYLAVVGTNDDARRAAVLDLADDTWMTMPGMPIQATYQAHAFAIAWSGQTLAAVTATPPSAVAWQPGTPTTYQLPI